MGWFLDAVKDFLYVALVETWYLGLSLTVIAAYFTLVLSEVMIEPKLGKAGAIAFQVLGFVCIFGIAISLFDTNPIFASFMMLLTLAVYWSAYEDEILLKLGIRKKGKEKGTGKGKAATGSPPQKASVSEKKDP